MLAYRAQHHTAILHLVVRGAFYIDGNSQYNDRQALALANLEISYGLVAGKRGKPDLREQLVRTDSAVAGTLVEILNRHDALAPGAFKNHLRAIGEEGGGAVARYGCIDNVAADGTEIAYLR